MLMVFPATTLVSGTAAGTGAWLTSLTTMTTVPVLLIGGVPLSVTLTRTLLLDGPCNSEGVHVSTPLVAFKASPDIGGRRGQAKVCGGCSRSLTAFEYVSVASSLTIRLFVATANVGGVLLRTVRTTSLPSP